jgi:capsular polysaccharide biosynthesis protein
LTIHLKIQISKQKYSMQEDDETEMLDLLLIVAENLRLLIMGAVIAGLLTLAWLYTKPREFVSQAQLLIPSPSSPTLTPTLMMTPPQTAPQVVAIMTSSPVVLEPVIESLGLQQGLPLEAARKALSNHIKASISKEGLLRLDVTSDTPQKAQTIANAVIDAWLKTTKATASERPLLEERYASTQKNLKSVNTLLERLAADGAVSQTNRITRGEVGANIVILSELQAKYLTDSMFAYRELNGFSRDVVIQAPTLPVAPVSQRKDVFVALAVVGAILMLLLFIFMRKAWRTAAADPETARKQTKLLSLLYLKR